MGDFSPCNAHAALPSGINSGCSGQQQLANAPAKPACTGEPPRAATSIVPAAGSNWIAACMALLEGRDVTSPLSSNSNILSRSPSCQIATCTNGCCINRGRRSMATFTCRPLPWRSRSTVASAPSICCPTESDNSGCPSAVSVIPTQIADGARLSRACSPVPGIFWKICPEEHHCRPLPFRPRPCRTSVIRVPGFVPAILRPGTTSRRPGYGKIHHSIAVPVVNCRPFSRSRNRNYCTRRGRKQGRRRAAERRSSQTDRASPTCPASKKDLPPAARIDAILDLRLDADARSAQGVMVSRVSRTRNFGRSIWRGWR